jgi:16S rRNA (cytidine1402-2'-O)-methyltransferase
MGSGLNGQSFCFSGYLPVKEPARSQRIKQLEQTSKKENQTQLFIETPYRNNQMLEELIKHCMPDTKICIAQNITAADEYIKTRTAAEWKKDKPVLEKQPAVFLMLG